MQGMPRGFSVFKKVSLYGLAGLGVFLLTCLLLNQWRDNPLKHQLQSVLETKCTLEDTDAVEEDDMSKEIERFVDIDGRTVRDQIIGYQYPNGTYYMSARNIRGNIGDLVREENGKPIRSIILTTWRSGSTFLSEIIASDPGNFLHHEPLLDFGMVVVRGPPLAKKALEKIRKLFDCEYENLQDDYLEYVRDHPYNSRRISETVRKRCIANSSICNDHRYLNAMCKLSPFHSMKFTRLRLHVAQELLADEKLAVRIALLVRDPRGTVQSRKKAPFCVGPDCDEPALLCADLSANYKTAVELKNKYPNTFTVIRYEDLATDVYKEAEEILKFYGRDYHPKVREFLDTHTTTNKGDLHSTARDSKTTPFHWKNDLDFKQVEEIQRDCETAMGYWGYVPAMNATHLREFHPMKSRLRKRLQVVKEESRKKIRSLQQNLRRQTNQITTSKSVLKTLREKQLLNEEQSNMLHTLGGSNGAIFNRLIRRRSNESVPRQYESELRSFV